MTHRLLAALVAFCLFGSPALGAFCGFDCFRAQEAADASHDCHEPDATGEGDAIGASPAACSHVRLENEPAKLTPGLDTPVTLRHATLAAGFFDAAPDVCSPLWRGAVRPDDSISSNPSFARPLRI